MRRTRRDRDRHEVRLRSEADVRRRLSAIGEVACLLGAIAASGVFSAGVAYASVIVNVPCSPSTPGGGPAGLVAAIDDANARGGGTINLAPACTYSLASAADHTNHDGLPIVVTPITINGKGSVVIRNSAELFRIFEVEGPGSLTLNVLTVAGGEASNGGGILNTNGGTLTLNISRVDLNSAILSGASPTKARGGGISNESGDTVTLNNSRVDHNAATGIAGALAVGGGLYEDSGGTFRLSASQVDHNQITATNLAFGGGIGIDFRGAPRTLELNSSQVDNNLVDATSDGPGVIAKGGGIGNNGTTLTVNTSQVVSNTVSAPGGDVSGGGIISLANKDGQPFPGGLFALNDSQVTGNTASGSSAGGGGISNQVSTLKINASQVDDNTANGIVGADGGAIENKLTATLSVTTTQLSGNLARAPRTLATGGGLSNVGASASLSLSTVTGNTASGSPGEGGGVFNSLGLVTSFFSLIAGNAPDNCFPPGTVARCGT